MVKKEEIIVKSEYLFCAFRIFFVLLYSERFFFEKFSGLNEEYNVYDCVENDMQFYIVRLLINLL